MCVNYIIIMTCLFIIIIIIIIIIIFWHKPMCFKIQINIFLFILFHFLFYFILFYFILFYFIFIIISNTAFTVGLKLTAASRDKSGRGRNLFPETWRLLSAMW